MLDHTPSWGTRTLCSKPQIIRSRAKRCKCYNCHKKGHFSQDCYGPGGTKEGQGPQSNKGGQKPNDSYANATNDAPNGAWSTITCGTPPHPIIDTSDIYLEEVSEPMAIETAHSAAPHPQADSHTLELYNSGATCHMTPLWNSLTNY